jgi:FKBP-type peptidyl-prolyl cis-trans isomerase FkpA
MLIPLPMAHFASIVASSLRRTALPREGRRSASRPVLEWAAVAALALASAAPVAAQPAAPSPQAALDAAAKEPGAVRTSTGLVYRSLKDGTGESPTASDTVRVHYRGTLPDGREFDSSHKRGQPAEFPLNRVIPCWTEGLQRMKVGGKAMLACPAAIAYGDRSVGALIGPGSTLLFEVELLGVTGR